MCLATNFIDRKDIVIGEDLVKNNTLYNSLTKAFPISRGIILEISFISTDSNSGNSQDIGSGPKRAKNILLVIQQFVLLKCPTAFFFNRFKQFSNGTKETHVINEGGLRRKELQKKKKKNCGKNQKKDRGTENEE